MFRQKINFILILVISIAVLSCGGKKSGETSSTILSKNEMIKILSDIQIAEATLNVKNYKRDSADIMATAFYNSIFKNHKITYQIFEESFKYYSDNPALLDEIYQQVVDDLSMKQSKVKRFAPPIPANRDSIHHPRKTPLGFKHLPQQDN